MIDFDSLNKNLIQAENIISSRYHFWFPDLEDADIANTDMLLNVLQARVIAEGVCRFIVLQQHLVKDEKSIKNCNIKGICG